jgi:transcriptional regulator with XRE-family HTH domain
MNSPEALVPNRDSMSPNGDSQGQVTYRAEFAERLATSAARAGFNAARLSAEVGITRGTMARYWRGERMFPADLLFHVASILSVDAQWLVTGEGAGLDSGSPREAALIKAFRQLPPDQQDHVLRNAELLAEPRTVHSGRASYRAEPID